MGDHHELIKLFVWLNWISEMLIFVNPFFILYLFLFNPNCFTDPILSGMPQGVVFSNDKEILRCSVSLSFTAGCSARAALN